LNSKNKLSLAIGDIRLKLRKKKDSITLISRNYSLDLDMGPALSSSIEFEDILSETTQPKHSTVFQKYMQKQYRTIE
jgi:hypothetical protein